ncbi:hypothetical protein ACLOJK_021494 [Asimina triloba]
MHSCGVYFANSPCLTVTFGTKSNAPSGKIHSQPITAHQRAAYHSPDRIKRKDRHDMRVRGLLLLTFQSSEGEREIDVFDGMPTLHSVCLSSNPYIPRSTKPTRIPPPAPAPAHLQSLLQLPEHRLDLQFKEKILALEVMGVDSGRALARNPSLLTASLSSIHSVVSFLLSKGIHHKDMGRIFTMFPTILTSDIHHDLSPVFHFLSQDLHVPPTNYRKPINKCPRLLAASARDQLKPALIYLQRLGITNLEGLAYNVPIVLVSSVEGVLKPKLECLVGLGFPEEEAIGMVVRCLEIFTYSVERNLKPKFEYYVGEMGGSLEGLRGFPHYFGFSLENRIKPRHREAAARGLKLPLGLMLKSTNDQFAKLLKDQGK